MTDREHRAGFLRRRPVVSAIGAMLLASAIAGGYLYLDYARHFESTDDAFIAARQFTIAPKVSGYITDVPVTDNQHVETGDVLPVSTTATYDVALEQAQAQVAAAQANIQNIDAQIDVQQAQISTRQAQVDQAQAALDFAQAAGGPLPGPGAHEALAPSRTRSIHLDTCTSSRLRCRARRRPSSRHSGKSSRSKAQRKSAVASLAQAQAQRDQARAQSLLHDRDGGPARACRQL